MPPNHPQCYRGVQRNPKPGTATYMQGKKQTALSIQRFHILCAAVQNKYELRDITPLPPKVKPVPTFLNYPRTRVTIDFSAYKEFKLNPIKDVEIIDPSYPQAYLAYISELLTYDAAIRDDWRIQEGGILCALASYNDFFGSISNYHSTQKTTRIPGWDMLFEELQKSEYRKNLIPCMYFGTKDGCLDQNCPFLHDHDAVIAARAHVIEARKKRFNYKRHPTMRQQMGRYHSILDYVSGGDEQLRAEIEKTKQVDREIGADRAYCANPRCQKPWKEGEKNKPLKSCKGCKYTMYCSPECQKMDWPRHKKDPCRPIEEIVENDDLWNPNGTRKGTTFFKTMRDQMCANLSPDT